MRPTPLQVEALRRGDPAVMAEVFEALRPRLYGFLLRQTGQPEVAAELVQEAFLRLARHARRLDADCKVDLWLFVVARNLARSWWRWSFLDGDRLLRVASGWLGAPEPASAWDEVALAEDERRVEAAVRALPAAQREVVTLLTTGGLSPEEAAEVLGLRPDAVRQRWSRALATLRAGGGDGA